jgi:predicted permease
MRQASAVEDMGRDLRHAVRVLRRSPGFTAVAVLTLALGIGATTAIFSVVYGVLLKPLPFREPERLVGLYHRGPGANLPVMNQGEATWFVYRDNQRAFEGIGAWDGRRLSVTGRGEPERVEALAVTDRLLPVLGIQPMLGRAFTPDDDTPGRPLRVMLTHGYWQRAFGGAPEVVGQSLQIEGAPAEVIGVLSPSFKFLRTDPALLVPLQLDRADETNVSFGFQALGRLKPGTTLDQANADVARMIPIVVQKAPRHEAFRLEPNVRPLAQDVIGDVGRLLWILLATVGVVLLIACVNVANLFLVRAEGRQQELAVRAALGASRGRIARALLAESVALGLAGGAVGLLLAEAALGLLRRIAPATLPRVDEIALDPAVLLFALAVSLVTGLLFGSIPVLRVGTGRADALKEGGRGSSDGRGRQRTRSVLAAAEVAMALVLLVVSGLMIRTFVAMRGVEPGFVHPEAVQTFRIAVPQRLVEDAQHAARLHEQIAGRLAQVPGVASVGLSSSITMDGEDNGNPLFVEHVGAREGELPALRRFKTAGPGYFETMGNPVVAGRAPAWSDVFPERRVVVLSENLAREYWPTPADALGKRVRTGGTTWYEVVGVVGDERDDGLNQPPTPIVYWPLVNDSYMSSALSYSVRSARVGTPGFLRELQQAVWSVNPDLPLANVQTLDQIRAESMAQTSFAMVMLAIAAVVALLLGTVGIYGVIAYVAAQRTREVGIRMALGAQTGDVRRLFLRYGLLLTGAGITLGIGVALALTRVMSALLFGVGATDPATYAVVSGVLAAIALFATWIPARRASRIDPMAALRLDA